MTSSLLTSTSGEQARARRRLRFRATSAVIGVAIASAGIVASISGCASSPDGARATPSGVHAKLLAIVSSEPTPAETPVTESGNPIPPSDDTEVTYLNNLRQVANQIGCDSLKSTKTSYVVTRSATCELDGDQIALYELSSQSEYDALVTQLSAAGIGRDAFGHFGWVFIAIPSRSSDLPAVRAAFN